MHSVLLATGSYIPEHRQSNQELEQLLGLESGWIQQRTGVEFRAIADPDDAVSDLAVRAGQVAIENWEQKNGRRDEISILILATSTPDHLLPPTSAAVATELGLKDAAAFDLMVACSGFAYAMIVADSLVRAQGANVLVIAANILSRRCLPDDPKTRPIFADAAGAVILGPHSKDGFFRNSVWQSDGVRADSLLIPEGGSKRPFNANTFDNQLHLMHLEDGSAVFRYAVEKMAGLGLQVVDEAGLSIDDVDWWVPHQANLRIVEGATRILKIPPEKTLLTLPQFGNSSSATIPVTLDYFIQQEPRISSGDTVLLTAAAAGMTSAAVLLKIP